MGADDSPTGQARHSTALYAQRQRDGLTVLLDVAKRKEVTGVLPVHHGLGDPRVRRRDRSVDAVGTVPLEKRKAARGALAASYDIPSAEFRPGRAPLWMTVAAVAVTGLLGRHLDYLWTHPADRPLFGAWLAGTLVVTVQWVLSWRDRPKKPTARQRAQLDRLYVVISVPVHNEAPEILDRTIWAAVNQTRPAQVVYVVDDGSTVDYSPLRAHWEGQHGPVRVVWERKPNGGKKSAQAPAFAVAGDGILVTVDSDSALAAVAIERGLAPFADPRVQSVAGMELAYNHRVNWVTRTVDARCVFFQVVACGAQSVFGQTLVNRGPFALYRQQLVRETLPAYLGETFLGRRVKLGDDAALALFATGRGKAVQQANAFAFSMYPEHLGQQRRQWIRWMRGSTIRNTWRIRYLPPWSYGWWFTLLNVHLFLTACCVPFAIAASWPRSEGVGLWILGASVPWAYLSGLRILSVRRSDENGWGRLVTLLCYPASIMWVSLYLRWLRLWGIATCLKQGWNTRQGGPENLTTGEIG